MAIKPGMDDYFGHSMKNLWELLRSIPDQPGYNDRIGIIDKVYYPSENFGIGAHDTDSMQNVDNDTLCDFTLHYHIEEVAGG